MIAPDLGSFDTSIEEDRADLRAYPSGSPLLETMRALHAVPFDLTSWSVDASLVGGRPRLMQFDSAFLSSASPLDFDMMDPLRVPHDVRSNPMYRAMVARLSPRDSIGSFRNEPYAAVQPIPVKITVLGHELMAEFEEANIAMTGITREEAIDNLSATILDTFEDYTAQGRRLGPGPLRQLAILKRYVAKRPL